jgi:drug/metabolite transporter (DMT)-like permease
VSAGAAAGTAAPRRLAAASADALLLLAAIIWGSAFVAQKLATAHMGPLRFTGIRFAAGALVLLPVAAWRWRRIASARARRDSVLGGLLAGVAMAVASTTQQVGMHETSVSHAGFITSLYVIIVPFLGMLVGQRVGWNVWAGAVLAVAGLFFLSLWNPGGSVSMSRGDLWVLACALAWSIHVQVIGWAAREADAFVVSAVQFAVTGAFGLAAATAVSTLFPDDPWGASERFDVAGLEAALWPLAYATLLSTCVAFTLQTVAQSSAPPSHAAIILGLESVFAALAEAAFLALGWAALGAPLTAWKTLGCALMFVGVFLSQRRSYTS